MPKSLEGYYQEAGRAGRDGKVAHSIVFYRNKDIGRVKQLITMRKKAGEDNICELCLFAFLCVDSDSFIHYRSFYFQDPNRAFSATT